MNINALATAFVAAGGLGFINYYVADRLGLIDFKENNLGSVLPFMLMWSVFDFSIYLFVQWILSRWLNGNVLLAAALACTALLVLIVFAETAGAIFAGLDKLLNHDRKSLGKAEVFSVDPWEYLTETDGTQEVFIFDLTGAPITAGWLDYTNRSAADHLTMNLIPFTDNPKAQPLSQLMDDYSTEEAKKAYQIRQFVDLDRKIVIVSVSSNAGVKIS